MGNIYDFKNSNFRSSKKFKFDLKLIFIAIACYCFDNLGAFVVLMFSRGKSNRLVTFHAAQSMLFYLLLYFGQVVLQSLGLVFPGLFQIVILIKITFMVFGIYNLLTGKPLKIPYLSEIASRWV